MAITIIVSYDGTHADQDALALGKVLGDAGADLELAYVRHQADPDPEREKEAQAAASALLERGAEWLGRPGIPTRVILSASTPDGLRDHAIEVGASAIVFGSEYRTTPGHVSPGTSAERLLDLGPTAVAVAPAGLAERGGWTIRTIAAVNGEGDPGALETAQSLAGKVGATVVTKASGAPVDLLVLGSKSGTAQGRVTISAAARYLLDTARCPVLVVPRGAVVRFNGSSGGAPA